jgi:hypothetical protein
MTAKQIASGLRTTMRGSARLMGLFSIGLYLLFIVESGLRIVPMLSWSEFRGMPLFLALTVAVLGLIIAWGWETLGGFLALAGGASILALAYAASGPGMTFTAALLALPLLAAGLLHLVGSVWTGLVAQPDAPVPQAVKSSRRVRTSTAQCRLKAQKRQAHA